MTERQLEERLRAALEHAAPNDVEGGPLPLCPPVRAVRSPSRRPGPAPRSTAGSLWPLPPALCSL